MSSQGETYKPSEVSFALHGSRVFTSTNRKSFVFQHDGLKKDGTPDKRVSSEHGFGGSDGPDPHVEVSIEKARTRYIVVLN